MNLANPMPNSLSEAVFSARKLQLRITEVIRTARPTRTQSEKLRELHHKLNHQTFATPSQERAVEDCAKSK